MTVLRLVLGDQLNRDISSLRDCDKENDIIFLCEVWDETKYVKHHKKKIAFLFSAMRHFAKELKEEGYNVRYTKLTDDANKQSFTGEIERAVQELGITQIIVTEAGEYRVQQHMQSWDEKFGVDVEIRLNDHFLCSHEAFKNWAEDRTELRMEYFYRVMRRDYNILIDKNGKPEGGQWNYDSENRKPPKEGLDVPETYHAQTDDITNEVIELVAEKFDDHFGDLRPFHFAVTRDQALQALDQFIKERLQKFGDYQDAMIEGEPWMYHSHISFYINCGLLTPLECIKAAEEAYQNGYAPLNCVEGFIRQILGWREYVRGIYWMRMPGYDQENYLEATRKLPWFYWGGDTHMNCIKNVVTETKENAYAHHIQRLMITGNFALIAGLHPDEVNEWYLIVYADAYQWVELPNVTGMILFADGGLLASKPYASSGAYINRMSNYCASCKYKVSKKNGPDACPFNYLYWNFLDQNKEKLQHNPRMGMMYRNLERMDEEKLTAVREDSKRFFTAMENGDVV